MTTTRSGLRRSRRLASSESPDDAVAETIHASRRATRSRGYVAVTQALAGAAAAAGSTSPHAAASGTRVRRRVAPPTPRGHREADDSEEDEEDEEDEEREDEEHEREEQDEHDSVSARPSSAAAGATAANGNVMRRVSGMTSLPAATAGTPAPRATSARRGLSQLFSLTSSSSRRRRTRPNPWEDQQEEALHFLLKPHTLTGLAVLMIVAVTGALVTPGASMEMNVKTGLVACYLTLCLFAMLQFRDGIFFRPNPVLWRLVLATCLTYLLMVVLLMYQDPADGRFLMRYLDSSLGVPIPPRSYAFDCSVWTPNHPESYFANVRDTVLDRFMIAHLVGWWGKTVIIRDPVVVWFLSVTFEFLEMTFQTLLPNFQECWWDHWLLDVLGMNTIGIYLGYLTLNWLEAKPYTFVGLNQTVGFYPKVKRAFWQFSPMSWTEFHWEMLRSPHRCLSVWFLCFLVLLTDLNAFFMKHVLWVPPDSALNTYRLLMLWALAAQGIAEYHEYISNDKVKRMGAANWLCIAIAFVELLVVIKYSPEQYGDAVFPGYVLSLWATFFSMVFGWFIFYFYVSKSHLNRQYPISAAPSPSSAVPSSSS